MNLSFVDGAAAADVAVTPQPGALPAETTSFVGRKQELAQARRLLARGRLLTMTGPGGVGKTRLALRAASRMRRAFAGDVFLVELAGLRKPELLPQTVAAALGLRDLADDPTTRLVAHLEDKRLLLVMDNCEHMVQASAVLIGKLLAGCPGVRVLATSRHVLGVAGEQALPVPPLALPKTDAVAADADQAVVDSVRLFTDRARAVVPGFVVDEGNAGVIAQICQRLDGIPLAIELAARRLRSLSLPDLLNRLDDRFRVLTKGSRAALPRQQTLAALFDWSYELCSPREQAMWARLSAFAGTFDLGAAEEVAAGDDIAVEDVLELVAGLVDKSILTRQETRAGRAYYRMLETVRQYGAGLLVESGQQDVVRMRHRDYYHRLAMLYRREYFGPNQMEWVARTRAEYPDVRVALEYGLSNPGQVRGATETATGVWSFWFFGGYFVEGYQWLQRVLAADTEPSNARGDALWTCAALGVYLGRTDAVRRMLDEADELAERLDDGALRADITEVRGLAALHIGDLVTARSLLASAVDQQQAVGDVPGVANSLILLARVSHYLGDDSGERSAARALRLCDEYGATLSRCHALRALAMHRWRGGCCDGADDLLKQAIRLQWAAHDRTGLAHCLGVLALCAATTREYPRAARLLGAADALWTVIGGRLDTSTLPQRMAPEWAVEQSRQELGGDAYDTAYAEGHGWNLDEMIGYALQDKPMRPRRRLAAPGGLTRREHEVAGLVAEGLTNREIAGRLVVSQRTAETHVEHVLTKLGFGSRAQIAAWIAENRVEQ